MKTKYLIALWLFLIHESNSQINYTQNVFAFIGDYGSDDEDEDSVSKLVKSWYPEAIITLGDNNYPNGSAADIDKNIGKYYHDYIKPYSGIYGPEADKNRFWPALGNHDLMTSMGAPYFSYFQLPNNERYYDFTIGDIHFFCLNSDPSEIDGVTETSIQGNWLKNKLQNSTSKWKIVYGHHSPYGSDDWYGNHPYMQWPFKNWGADIIISAHAHVYERLVVNNFPYIICGLGGQSKYDFAATPEPGSVVRYNDKYGTLQLKAKPDSLLFRFYTVNHEMIDYFSITKTALGLHQNEKNPCAAPRIYPNPFKGTINIDFQECKVQCEEFQISITDVLGNEIHREYCTVTSDNSLKSINLSETELTGVFILRLNSKREYFTSRLVLVR